MSRQLTKSAISRLGELITPVALSPMIRLHRVHYSALDVVPSNSRFCSQHWPFGTIYMASTLRTAFVETILRNRLDGKAARTIPKDLIDVRQASKIQAPKALNLINLLDQDTVAYGVPSAVTKDADHRSGVVFAEAMIEAYPELDGILFPSRLDGRGWNAAIFDRRDHGLTVLETSPLIKLSALDGVLEDLNIKVMR